MPLQILSVPKEKPAVVSDGLNENSPVTKLTAIARNASGKSASCEEMKLRINLREVFEARGIELKRSGADWKCLCPFHEERTPSCAVYEDRFKCFACPASGDVFDFIQKFNGVPFIEAKKKVEAMIGGGFAANSLTAITRNKPANHEATTARREKPTFPAMDSGTRMDVIELASRRAVCRQAVTLCVKNGLIQLANLHGHRSWILTDGEGLNAQARRLDGLNWSHINDAKAWTLPGSHAAWPIGIRIASNHSRIMLCEGGGDFLAAWHFIIREGDCDVAPAAMLGASQRIHADALPFFEGKEVTIYVHDDKAGEGAKQRWAEQLQKFAARIDAVSFEGMQKPDGTPVKDLNDCCYLVLDAAKSLKGVLL